MVKQKLIVLSVLFAPLVAHAGAFQSFYQTQRVQRLAELRARPAYARARALCSEIPGGPENWVYIKASMEQVSALMGLHAEAQWQKLMHRRYYVSPLLASDLQSDAFRLGLEDCGLGVHGQDRVVISVIADDLLGKMLFMVPFAKMSEYGGIGLKMFADWLVRMGTPAKILTLFFAPAITGMAYQHFFGDHAVTKNGVTANNLNRALQMGRLSRDKYQALNELLIYCEDERARTTDRKKIAQFNQCIAWIQRNLNSPKGVN